jgi:hypothetical protein
MLKVRGALGALVSGPKVSRIVDAARRLASSPAAQAARATITRHVKDALQTGAVEVVLDLVRPSHKGDQGGQS